MLPISSIRLLIQESSDAARAKDELSHHKKNSARPKNTSSRKGHRARGQRALRRRFYRIASSVGRSASYLALRYPPDPLYSRRLVWRRRKAATIRQRLATKVARRRAFPHPSRGFRRMRCIGRSDGDGGRLAQNLWHFFCEFTTCPMYDVCPEWIAHTCVRGW